MTRKSKRELEKSLADLASEDPADATVVEVLSAETIDVVSEDPPQARVDGELMRFSPAMWELLADPATAEEEGTDA